MKDRNKGGDGPLEHRRWLVPGSIVAVVALLASFVLVTQRGPGGEPEHDASADSGRDRPAEVTEPEQPDLSDLEQRDPDDPLTAGPVDAPVGLVVFSDYQCPFCASWSEETLPEMMAHAEAGDLRIEWRDVNVFGDASERAARASYAAALQGRYWDYHEALFSGGEPRPESALSDDGLVELAGELGLDVDQFAEDFDSTEVREQVRLHAREGIELGILSTPAFILGGEPIVGAQPTEVFLQAMDRALARAGQ